MKKHPLKLFSNLRSSIKPGSAPDPEAVKKIIEEKIVIRTEKLYITL